MAETETVVETPAAPEESIEAYFARANAAEKAGTLAEVDAATEAVSDSAENLAATAEEPPAEAVAKVEEPVKPAKKPRNDPQARIDQITAKQKEAERKAEEAERRAAQLERDLAAARQPAKVEPVQAPTTATAAAFPDYGSWAQRQGNGDKTYEDYLEARLEHKIETRQRAEQQTKAEAAAVERLETSNAAFRERLTASIKDEPEFLNTVDRRLTEAVRYSAFVQAPDGKWYERGTGQPLPPPTFANWLSEQIFTAENPKVLLRHLSDVQEVQRLSTLQPEEVLRILARLDVSPADSAATRGPAKQSPKSQAPAPIQPLGTAPAISDETDESDLPIEQFVRKGNARDRKAGRF